MFEASMFLGMSPSYPVNSLVASPTHCAPLHLTEEHSIGSFVFFPEEVCCVLHEVTHVGKHHFPYVGVPPHD